MKPKKVPAKKLLTKQVKKIPPKRKPARAPKRKKAAHPSARVDKRISSSGSADSHPRTSKQRAKAKAATPARRPTEGKWYDIPEHIQADFLRYLSNGEKHCVALKLVGLEWRKVSAYMTHDPAFKELYEEAVRIRNEYVGILREESADDRAINGWEDPIYQGGVRVGERRLFSDRLMELRLKATDPGKYADRHEHTGAGGGPVAVVQMVGGPARPATIAEWEKQRRELEAVKP
jgi:hypothetical protein